MILIETILQIFPGLLPEKIYSTKENLTEINTPVPYMQFKGTKDPPPNESKNSKNIRIFALGGSTVHLGDPSILYILKNYLEKDGFDQIEVYNFGISGAVSGQYLTMLLHEIVDYQPDIVIVYDGGNNIFQPWFHDPRPGYPYDQYSVEAARRLILNEGGSSQTIAFLLNKTWLARIINTEPLTIRTKVRDKLLSLENLRNNVGFLSEDWKESIIQTYIGHLEKMCLVAKGGDFLLFSYLQPLLQTKTPLVGDEKRLMDWYGEGFNQYIRDQMQKARTRFRELEKSYFNDPFCHFKDISRSFENYDKESYTDLIHINQESKPHIASKIYNDFKPIFLNRFPR